MTKIINPLGRTMQRRDFLKVAGTSVAIAALPAAVRAANPVKVVLWSWVPDLQLQVDMFNGAHPGIQIELVNAGQGNPEYQAVRAGLKAGSGLIVDMGRKVRLKSATVTFGSAPGADVSIKIGNDDTLAASALPTFTTVATGVGVGGRHTFKATRRTRGRYVLIWFTRLPPASQGRYEAEIFNIVFHGWR